MKNLLENKPQMFCPRCGGQVEINVPDVKFCRFCGLSLTESRESVQGLTEIKQTGLKFSVWGYVILQILYLVVFLTIISSLSIWSAIILLIVFALSNGFFIAGNFAVGNPEKYQKKSRSDTIETKTSWKTKNLTDHSAASITERTTRKLFKSAV